MKKFDFIAIGDITTDAFIRLEEKSAHCFIDKGNLELCVNFGDKIPYEFVKEVSAVGNSPNASVSASRLGLRSALITNLGKDINGEKCIASLKANGVNCDFVSVQNDKKSNYHYVLWYEDDRTILVKHEKYQYKLPDFGEPEWIYLSSIGRDTEQYHIDIADYLEKHPSIKMAFQPGTFQLELGKEKLKKIYSQTELLAINKKEAQEILGTKEEDPQKLVENLQKLGPKSILMTNGPKGAYFYDGKEMIFTPPYPDPKPPYDRTGAGDAYASTFVSALILGKTPREASLWASINSMSVVQKIGAQEGLLSQKEIEKYLTLNQARVN